MKFTQQLTDANHRYIFRSFFRYRHPLLLNLILPAILLTLAAWQYYSGSGSPITTLVILVIYSVFVFFVRVKILEVRIMRNVRKSISYDKTITYQIDNNGIAYTVANGKTYQFYWKNLSVVFCTKQAVLLRFGKQNGLCFFKEQLGEQNTDKLIEILQEKGAKIKRMRGWK